VMNAIPAILLVGGLGTRLRSVLPSTPKPLASVGTKSILELLVIQLRNQGIRRIIMCTGFLAEQVESHFGDGNRWGVAIDYSREQSPLGTGGAIKLAESHLSGVSELLVMNGDSFLEIDLRELVHFHRRHEGLASMAVLRVDDSGRYGTVEVAAGGHVIGFAEKTGVSEPGLVNGGIYVFNRPIFNYLPDGPASLERHVFPRILSQGLYALEQRGTFIDIGTPEDYARAQDLSDRLSDIVSRNE